MNYYGNQNYPYNYTQPNPNYQIQNTEQAEKNKKYQEELKSIIGSLYPTLTDVQINGIIVLKERMEKAIAESVSIKSNSGIIKSLVSKSKNRFCYDGFDLDLSYITARIIVMGFPATSLEGIYRNKMDDVKRFFNTRHQFHYKIYNLCSEKTYPKDTFYRQGYYPFMDHEAPPLDMIYPFCQDAKAFMEEDPKNVVAIHCKAGKGRSGTFVCCLMLFLRSFISSDECMAYYGIMRTGNGKGITIPSQIRYVKYFEKILTGNLYPLKTTKKIIIRKIIIYGMPVFSTFGSTCTPTFVIENGPRSYKYIDYIRKKESFESFGNVEFYLGVRGFEVQGDVKVEFYHIGVINKDKIFKFWFNTNFLTSDTKLVLNKNEIDKACKDVDCKNFKQNFKVEVDYLVYYN